MSAPFFVSYPIKIKRPPGGGLIKNKDECYLSDKSLHQSSKIESRIWYRFFLKCTRHILMHHFSTLLPLISIFFKIFILYNDNLERIAVRIG